MVPLTISHLVMNIGIINLQPRFQLNMNMLANQVRWRRAFNLSTYYIYTLRCFFSNWKCECERERRRKMKIMNRRRVMALFYGCFLIYFFKKLPFLGRKIALVNLLPWHFSHFPPQKIKHMLDLTGATKLWVRRISWIFSIYNSVGSKHWMSPKPNISPFRCRTERLKK